ncbi:SDR family oxidoreductase [Pelagicoccus sp. SDUM812003]|uniref:SDR family oxidoreductase n=1 Tax=Pelagicoccus sp. SDUM812003 TaxID=3041267 RepID=UPI00281089BF|nr:SDR family oxidoreductase [Pelagicoccus sp. SDUM812003]MDQ8204331.1 SDR family oxidoreductase [Pelagicoccus sp. SDUM812003]
MILDRKSCLITGATSGIGKEIARRFLQEGARVAVNYRSDDEKKERTERELWSLLDGQKRPRTDLLMVRADVSEKPSVEQMFEQTISQFGTLHVLVNNAGVESECPSERLNWEDATGELDVNLRGPTLCSLQAIRHFLERNVSGCILNNTSVHEVIPKPGFLPYSIAKGGLRMLTRTLALEFAQRGIRVNAVGAGVVDTKMNSALDDPTTRRKVSEHVPQRRVIEPEEIASAFLYLASDQAKSVTGQTLFVDGGLTLYPDFQENWSSP